MKKMTHYICILFLIPFFAFAQEAQPRPLEKYDSQGNYSPQRNPTIMLPLTKPKPSDPLSDFINPIKKNPSVLQPVNCKLNIMPVWHQGSFHTYNQVWICTYTDNAGAHTLYASAFDSNDAIKFLYHDLTKTGGKGMSFDTRMRRFIAPPSSVVFHTQILTREINKGNVLLPNGKPLPLNLLGLERRGGEPWISGNIFKSPRAPFQLPLGVMTASSRPPTTADGISFELLTPNAPISGSPTVGIIPDMDGLTRPNNPIITPRTLSDIFHGNMPFSSGFSIHVNFLTINWRNGPPEPMVSDDEKALIFPFEYKNIPFAIIITDSNVDHVYEAHIVQFEFFDFKKPNWSQVKFIKEFNSKTEFINFLIALPKPKIIP